MDKKKCEYCDNMIDCDKIRCENCDFIWNEGVKLGKECVRMEIKYMIDKFKGFLNE